MNTQKNGIQGSGVSCEEISEACGRFYVGTCRCGNECSTHPDACNPAAYCGDCGKVTCPDCRHIDDRAQRCFTCLPVLE